MPLPHDDEIQIQLLKLLDAAQEGTMHCQDAYGALRHYFPLLTPADVAVPYRTSLSKWANRVQFARLHLVLLGLLLPSHLSGRGFWTISPAGREYLKGMETRGEELLKELDEFVQDKSD